MPPATRDERVSLDGGGSSKNPSPFSPVRSKQTCRARQRRPRKPVSCMPCRKSKLRCDRQLPCGSCKRRECPLLCTYTCLETPTQSASVEHVDGLEVGSTSQPSPQLGYPGGAAGQDRIGLGSRTSQAVLGTPGTGSQSNGQSNTHMEWEAILQRSVDQSCSSGSGPDYPFTSSDSFCFPFSPPAVSREEILAMLPPSQCCDYLITEYFHRLSPLFHILHGPTFQRQYNAFKQSPSAADLSWIALLFAICSVTINTFDGDDSSFIQMWPFASGYRDLSSAAYCLRTAAMTCLSKDQFLIRHNLSTLEALLVLLFAISNSEGAERAWTLLGLTLNIGIALKCNTERYSQRLNCVEVQRRRRCWAGILLLHTYQATFFQDIDMSALLNPNSIMPADVNDSDIKADIILSPSTQPTQMSVMRFKIQMCQLSSQIVRHLSGPSKYNEAILSDFDAQLAEEQRQWDTVFLIDGSPKLLDSSSYAHWCILQLYAHQLYLLLHRPFCNPRGPRFISASRAKCIVSGTALLNVHRQLCDLPHFRPYRWLLSGLTSFYAIHGAIALVSCLLDEPKTVDLLPSRADFDAAVARIGKMQTRSQVCAKAYPVLSYLQTLLPAEPTRRTCPDDVEFGAAFNEWIDDAQWINPESVNWDFWNEKLSVNF